ncbi:restriction endonuclease subunit S [Bifidobacterium bifidum]|uniref:restriction endonuclease subunit S n=1 Tax=Bifidobacterium bifidum TaxID=1681 RepID=UPI003D366416
MTEQAKVPSIRFAGFTDPWEQRKLGDVATFGGGHTPSMADPDNYEDGYVLWVTSQDVKSNYLDRTTTQITEKGAKELTLYPAGSLVMVTRSGILRHTLPVAELRKPSTVNQDIRVILPQGECCGEWLLQFFISHNKELLLEFGKTGTTVESVDFGKIKDMLLYMPSTVEQQQIGDYFAKLDNLITLHQRKYDKLVVFKKSMLEKMFPKDGESVPEIRFAGFTDPWEQRKLGDYVVVSTAKNADGRFNKEDVLSVSGEYGIVNQIAFQGRSFAGSSVLNYGIVNTGDIVYTKSPLNSNPYGIIKVNKGIPGIVSTLYAVYRPQDNVHTNFIQVYFEQHERMNNYMHPLVNKGAKNDMKVTAENALKGVVTFPSREEQVIISEFFDRLDSLITLHQRKLELLRNIKKSLLDKMFV